MHSYFTVERPGEAPYRIHYREHGERDNPNVLFCVHGLTRNSRDFDFLADRLKQEYRLICADVVGRGDSDWLENKQDYSYPRYVEDSLLLLKALALEKVDWLGTSMGGIMGMIVATLPGNPIRRLIMNDIGPFLPYAALLLIRDYVGRSVVFANEAEAARYIRGIHFGFGGLSDEQWTFLARHSIRARETGGFELKYDPAIATAFDNLEGDIDLWSYWQQVKQPVLLLRGRDSGIFTLETAQRMLEREAPTHLVEFSGSGHAPMLMDDGQVGAVKDWLARSS